MQKQINGDDALAQQLLQKLQAQEGFVVQLWPPPELESFPPHPPAHVGAALTACKAYIYSTTTVHCTQPDAICVPQQQHVAAAILQYMAITSANITYFHPDFQLMLMGSLDIHSTLLVMSSTRTAQRSMLHSCAA